MISTLPPLSAVGVFTRTSWAPSPSRSATDTVLPVQSVAVPVLAAPPVGEWGGGGAGGGAVGGEKVAEGFSGAGGPGEGKGACRASVGSGTAGGIRRGGDDRRRRLLMVDGEVAGRRHGAAVVTVE